MPRGRLSKVDILSRVYKLKDGLYNGENSDKNSDWHDGAHEMLSRILDMLNEYNT
jgi:hypothetical protein